MSDWGTVHLELALPANRPTSALEALLWVGANALEVRDVRIFSDGHSLSSAMPWPRVKLWFLQPNLLGHSAAMLMFCVIFCSRRALWVVGLSVIGLALVALTGSRTALLVAIVGVFVLGLQSLRIQSRAWVFLPLTLLVVGLVWFTPGIRRDGLTLLSDGNLTPRTVIWDIARRAVVSHPFGLGTDHFQAYFETQIGSSPHEAVQHAHNFWLELGVRYGVLGLLASVWLTCGFVWLAWSNGRWKGVTLVVLALLLNLTDFTFFSAGVFFPLVLTLNGLRCD